MVELSIVLVIIGLLVGGITAGSSLIRQSELRSVATEFKTYQAAANMFIDKYRAVPGDMTNADTFWGASGCPAVCNGDGDGQIEFSTPDATRGNDAFLFWNHLANAGMIEGQFSGLQGSIGIVDVDPDINSPSAKLSGATWSANNQDGRVVGGFAVNWRNYFAIGSADTINGWINTPALTAEESWNIDAKLDDGKPVQGIVQVRSWGGQADCTDATADNDFNADYEVQSETRCVLQFIDVF